jgi:hypothetical protein
VLDASSDGAAAAIFTPDLGLDVLAVDALLARLAPAGGTRAALVTIHSHVLIAGLTPASAALANVDEAVVADALEAVLHGVLHEAVTTSASVYDAAGLRIPFATAAFEVVAHDELLAAGNATGLARLASVLELLTAAGTPATVEQLLPFFCRSGLCDIGASTLALGAPSLHLVVAVACDSPPPPPLSQPPAAVPPLPAEDDTPPAPAPQSPLEPRSQWPSSPPPAPSPPSPPPPPPPPVRLLSSTRSVASCIFAGTF